MNVTKKRIEELMYEKRITQAGLGDIVGVNQATLSRNLSGLHAMKTDLLVRIADYFNVSADYLLGRTNQRNPEAQAIEKTISTPAQSKSPFINEPVFKEITSLIDRLTRDELIMLKGMLMAIIGTDNKQNKKVI